MFSRMRHCVVDSAGSRSSSPQRSVANSHLVQCPPDVAVVQRPGSSLGMRSKVPTYRVAQSQGCSREASPERFAADHSVIQRQSELEAAVADALVSAGIIMMTVNSDYCNMNKTQGFQLHLKLAI